MAGGALLEVFDVQSPVRGLTIHRARVLDGEVVLGEAAEGRVDVERRLAISRAHTATHMVHKAFREALGESATQMGSENSPGRLRFDFPNPTAVPASVLADVEQRVNEVLLGDLDVTAEIMSQSEAVASGAMALFGEKYGDACPCRQRRRLGSRAVRRHPHATHRRARGRQAAGGVVDRLPGVRRVEALVGVDAYRFLAREHLLVQPALRGAEGAARGAARAGRRAAAPGSATPSASSTACGPARCWRRPARSPPDVPSVDGDGSVGLVAELLPAGVRPADARTLALDVRGRAQVAGPSVVVLGAPGEGGQISLVVASDPAAAARGAGAGAIMTVLAQALGGKGGGRDDVAQGAGSGDAEAFARAIAPRTRDARAVRHGREAGCRLGIDVGSVRIGVARLRPGRVLAIPVETVPRGTHDVERLVELAAEYSAVEVVVGLPVSLSGSHGKAAETARPASPRGWPASVHVPVRLVDERLSTVGRHRALQDAGVGRRRRRAVVDESAAVIILQTALDTERSTGSPAGVEVVAVRHVEGRGMSQLGHRA